MSSLSVGSLSLLCLDQSVAMSFVFSGFTIIYSYRTRARVDVRGGWEARGLKLKQGVGLKEEETRRLS
jgi:hypothetical protein